MNEIINILKKEHKNKFLIKQIKEFILNNFELNKPIQNSHLTKPILIHFNLKHITGHKLIWKVLNELNIIKKRTDKMRYFISKEYENNKPMKKQTIYKSVMEFILNS